MMNIINKIAGKTKAYKKIQIVTIFLVMMGFRPDLHIDYLTMLLPDLIEQSELVLHGQIVRNAAQVFDLEVFQVAKGEYKRDYIRIAKFKNWSCAGRWTPYAVGQEMLVFLQKDLLNDQWTITGAGNEGEMPIENDLLYYKTTGDTRKYFTSGEKSAIQGVAIHATTYIVAEVLQGISELLQELVAIQQMVSDESILTEYSTNSFKQRYLDEKIILNAHRYSADQLVHRRFGKSVAQK